MRHTLDINMYMYKDGDRDNVDCEVQNECVRVRTCGYVKPTT